MCNTSQSLLPICVKSEELRIVEMAHELKLPLFNIKSFLETLYEYNFDLTATQRLEFLETANKETNRLILLIHNLIELQYSESLPKIYQSSLQISNLLSQVVNSYRLTSKNKQINISYSFEKSDYEVCGNSDLIIQVINNLIGNSLKYTFPQKRIVIRTRVFRSISASLLIKREKLNISILDEGIGINRSNLMPLCNKTLYINRNDSNTKVKGTGLGLAVVKKIVDDHGAKIEVRNRMQGDEVIGAKVSILFMNLAKEAA